MADDFSTEIYRQMEDPGFYPHPANRVEIRETHISKVFLVGEYVYKIKKPLNLGFLDFTTLEKRRYYCLQEVALNRRLSVDIYLDVIPITLDGDTYRLGGSGPVMEYAVKMRRLPDHCTMTHRLETGGLEQAEIDHLTDVLVTFYDQPQDPAQTSEFGSWSVVSGNCDENFTQTAPFAGKLFDERIFEIIRGAVTTFLKRRKPLFDMRVETGKIQDCHGDLRTDHIYFIDDTLQIIDCIEFNPAFRYGDVASDLGFLVMDLDKRGHAAVAATLITGYIQRTGDANLFVLIDFYKCYRAMVRFKINCIRAQAPDITEDEKTGLLAGIKQYLDLAYDYAIRFTRPVLWVVCGMPASGKSTVAEKLGEAFRVPVFKSDIIRKEHFASPTENLSHLPFKSGIYSKRITALTYGRMMLLAQEEIEKGNSVILDATFSACHFRREAIRLAADKDANIFFIECTAPEALLKKRLSKRNNQTSLSDARLIHFDALRNSFEPLVEIHPDQHIVVDTEMTVDACMSRILYDKYMTLPKNREITRHLDEKQKTCLKTS